MLNALTLFLFLTLAFAAAAAAAATGVTQQLWCVAKNNADDASLQAALDWACGPGGADCGPIQAGGVCYDESDLIGMASLAFNVYCVKNGMNEEDCDFGGAAALTSLDPSHGNCKFQSSTVISGNFSTTSNTSSLDSSSADMRMSHGSSEVRTLQLLFFAIVMIFL
ncbi:hypothetical protein Droror1_Dr00003993 [Drosera rotundifolia]